VTHNPSDPARTHALPAPDDPERDEGLRGVEHDHPGWQAWPAILAGLVYARRPRSSPPMVVRATSAAGLHAEIEKCEMSRGLYRVTVAGELARLRDTYGGRYAIWAVPMAASGETWCARQHGAPIKTVLQAASPEKLEALILDNEAHNGIADMEGQ
jgi:hypothetical protein